MGVRSSSSPKTVRRSALAIALAVTFLHVSPGHTKPVEKWPRKLEFIELLKQRDFDRLESWLISIQRAFESGDAGEGRAIVAFRSFAYADPEVGDRLDEWVRRTPRSYAARLARGVYHTHLASLSRGDAIAWHTSPGQFAAMRRFIELARPDFLVATTLNSRLTAAYLGRISLAMMVGDAPGLFAAYSSGLTNIPDSKRLHLALLDALDPKWMGSRKLHELLRSYIAKRRKSSPLHESLARQFDLYAAEAHVLNRRFKQALEVFDRIIANSETAYVRYRRGNVLYMTGRYNAALSDFERAHALYPDYKDALTALAEFKVLYKAWPEALTYYDAAIRLDPYNPDILVGRFRTLIKMRRFVEAKADFDRALHYGELDAGIHAAWGNVLLTYRRDAERATRALKRAVNLAPMVQRYWILYAEALHSLRDCEFITVTATYLELCLRSGKCGRPNAVHISNLVGQFKREESCPQGFDMSHLRHLVPDPPPVTLDSNVRAMELAGLKLGDPREKVLSAFPAIKGVPPFDHQSASGENQAKRWKYQSKDHDFELRASFSRNGRLLGITVLNWVFFEGTLDEIHDRLIEKYGRPDKLILKKSLHMKYLHGDPGAGASAARPSAMLQIGVRLLDTPARRCKLPQNLRVGSTVAFMSMSLSDFAASRRESQDQSPEAVAARARARKREAEEYAKARARMRREGNIHVVPKLGPYDDCDTPERSRKTRLKARGEFRLP